MVAFRTELMYVKLWIFFRVFGKASKGLQFMSPKQSGYILFYFLILENITIKEAEDDGSICDKTLYSSDGDITGDSYDTPQTVAWFNWKWAQNEEKVFSNFWKPSFSGEPVLNRWGYNISDPKVLPFFLHETEVNHHIQLFTKDSGNKPRKYIQTKKQTRSTVLLPKTPPAEHLSQIVGPLGTNLPNSVRFAKVKKNHFERRKCSLFFWAKLFLWRKTW